MHEEDVAGDDPVALVRACAAGDVDARRRFQDRFAQDIYNFPIKIHRLAPERAGDFYLYVFEQNRIFTRLASFEGRGGIQLRTFLAYHVLRSLFLDWQRGERELETVSLSSPLVGHGETILEDLLASSDPEPNPAAERHTIRLWSELDAEEQLDLKLLSLIEHDLSPDDVRLLARLSGRSLDDTVALVCEVQAGLQSKQSRLAELTAELDSVWGWLVLRRRELQEVTEALRLGEGEASSAARQRLLARREDLERAVAKRSRQHARTLAEVREYKVTTSYKDIARLKGSTVGTVCSRIFRLRQRLERRAAPVEENT